MPKEDLYSTYDVIHGSTDISDVATTDFQESMARILQSPQLERLRGIKQLGFVSRGYPAADHSRYGHAVGSLQMMRKLFRRIHATKGLPEELIAHIAKDRGSPDAWEYVGQHLLLSAVLQDIGELPYHQATKDYFQPATELKRSLESHLGRIDFSQWSTKEVFTIGAIVELLRKKPDLFAGVDELLLTYLITGNVVGNSELTLFKPLRHMVDGVVDADRLDYVFRDGHHTIGYFGSPDSVIDSLLSYDADGPVFSEPAPVSRLLLMRAHLYSTVYLSPADRFQNELLRTILSEALDARIPGGGGDSASQECMKLQRKLTSLNIPMFLGLDDAELLRQINAMRSCDYLSDKARSTLDIFLDHQANYESVWLLPGGEAPADCPLPEDLFFDPFTGKALRIYRPRSVRVDCSRFGEAPVFLEETSSLIEALVANDWSPLPKPSSILLFRPKKLRTATWKQVDLARKSGALHPLLRDAALRAPLHPNLDTWGREEFAAPETFISYCSADWSTVREVVALLAEARQRSLVLADASGPYRSPAANSIELANKAAGYLLILSPQYVQRLSESPNETLSREFYAIAENVKSQGKPIAFLNYHDDREYLRGIPWVVFGHEPEIPVLEAGKDYGTLTNAVHRAVEYLRRPEGKI